MSNNLSLTQLSGSQDNKYVTINDANAEIDAALTEVHEVTFEAGDSNAVTISEGDFTTHSIFVFEDDVAEAALQNQVTFPGVKRGIFTVVNNTNNVLRVKTATQGVSDTVRPKPECPAKSTMTCWCDGDNIGMAGTGFISHNFYCQLADFNGGAIPTGSKIFEYRHPGSWWVWGHSDSSGGDYAARGWVARGTAPSGGDVVLDVQANGVSIGSIDFYDGETDGEINLEPDSDPEGAQGLVWGEALTIHTPADLHDMTAISIMIVGMI